jgi:DNA-binding SARP family transcriptional activator
VKHPNELFQSYLAARDEELAERLPETAGLAIHLLGGLQVRQKGVLLPRPFPTLKTASLFAFLLLHAGRVFPRGYLAGLFWPEADEDAAHGSLRTALVPIRKLLAPLVEPGSPVLISAGPTLQLTLSRACWVDVWEFERCCVEASRLPRESEAWYRALETAVDLHSGDLLPGFQQDWCGPARDLLQQRLLGCLHDLTTADRERKQYDRAIQWARRAVGVDYSDEQSHRQLMLLYALMGQRAKALQQYHDCRRYLREELGAAPDAETLHLFHWLQDQPRRERRPTGDGAEDASPTPQSGVPPPPRSPSAGGGGTPVACRSPVDDPPRPGADPPLVRAARAEEIVLLAELTGPLVGREREREQLQGAWQRARSRRGQFVLLTGEAGIGKSRLGRELLQEVALEGGLALYAPCYALEGNLPYQPVIAALRGALRLARQHALTLCEPMWLSEVARLLPELRHPAGIHPASEAVSSGWKEGTDLLEGLTQFFLALSAQRPLCLFFDDLQWADPATGRFLQYLSDASRQARILLIGAYREGEARGDTWLWQWMTLLQTRRMAMPVTLSRLSEADVMRLLLQLAESKASETLIRALGERLYEETEGNPFFLWEQLRALFEEGWPGLTEDGHWCVAGDRHTASTPETEIGDGARTELLTRPMPLPSTVRQAVRQRVSRLSEEDRRLLACAAVIGRRFTVETLRRAAGHELEATLTALERLLAADLIRAQSHPSVFEFSHDKIRAVLDEELLPARREELRRRVGEALEAIWSEEGGCGRQISPPGVGRQITLSIQ